MLLVHGDVGSPEGKPLKTLVNLQVLEPDEVDLKKVIRQ